MNLFPTDVLVLAVITHLLSKSPNEPISYDAIAQGLTISSLSLSTIPRSIQRLEKEGHLKRVGGLTRKGYRYELSSPIQLAITLHGN